MMSIVPQASYIGYPVDAETGKLDKSCFGRRKSGVKTKAFLNTSYLITALRKLQESETANLVRAQKLFDQATPSMDMEELWSFEHNELEESLQRSTKAWVEILKMMPACANVHDNKLKTKARKYLMYLGQGSRKLKPLADEI